MGRRRRSDDPSPQERAEVRLKNRLANLEQTPEKGNVAGRDVGFGISHPAPTKLHATVTYSLDEIRKQTATVEQLLQRGISPRTIIEQVSRQMGLTRYRVQRLLDRVKEKWASEDQHMRAAWKSAAIRRNLNHIREAQGYDPVTGQRTGKTNFAAIAKFETLLADIQGTREPLEVNVNMQYTEAMLAVIVQMPDDQLAEVVKEGLAMESAYKMIGSGDRR